MQTQPLQSIQQTQQMPASPPPLHTTGTNPPGQPLSPVQKNRYQQPTASVPSSPIVNSPYGQPMDPATYLPNVNGQPMQIGPNGRPLHPTQQQQQPMYPSQQHQQQYQQQYRQQYPQQYPQQPQQQPPLQMHQPVPQSADMIYAMEKQRKDERNAKIKKDFQNATADSCSFGARMCAFCTACFCGMICASI